MNRARPKHKTTWNDYKERILRVLTHIQEHLDDASDLEELARVACFSSFHFHRDFAAPPEKLRYDACVTVDENYVPTKPVRVGTIAGGDYAVVRNCPIGTLAKGYEKLFLSWLPQSGREARKAPSFLVAVNGPEAMPPAFGFTDIYVPLEVGKLPIN